MDDFNVVAVGLEQTDGIHSHVHVASAFLDFQRAVLPIAMLPPEDFPRPLDGPPAAVFLDRLEQVVHGTHFESTDGKLRVCGGEDNAALHGIDFVQGGESVGSRQLDIQEDEVRTVAPRELLRGDGIGSLRHDVHLADGCEHLEQVAAGGGFVVDDQGGEGFHGQAVVLGGGSAGRCSEAVTSPSAPEMLIKAALP